jgi:uncharacterized RDD family membrane protein YckC
LDGTFLGLVGAVSGLFLFDTYARMGGWGRLIGFCVAMAYFGVMNSSICKGRTIGKRLMGIEVVDAAGRNISLPRSCLRYFILGVPFFLNGAPIANSGPAAYVAGFLVLGLGGAIPYLYVFNRRTRQSAHDLATGTYVVMAGGSGAINAKPIWRTHLVIVGAWCIAVVGFCFFAPSLAKIGPFPDLLAVQQKIQASGKVSSASVFAGESWAYHNGEKRETSSLQAIAVMINRPTDYEALAGEIAATTLANYPGIAKKDVLIVTVCYGYDIGIAQTWTRQSFQHSPLEWENMLGGSK